MSVCLQSAQVAPAAAVGHLAELLAVDVEHVARLFVDVASIGSPVAGDVGETAEPAPAKGGVHDVGLRPDPVDDSTGPRRCFQARVHHLAQQPVREWGSADGAVSRTCRTSPPALSSRSDRRDSVGS